jgi:6-pyruvoyltetrahydropterin/6-carboxytetrahydropterin synthase
MFLASRYHDISTGHRVVGHEGKCRHLHGHNYRIHFNCVTEKLDSVGRVVDFGVIKEKLCMWLEDNWDHKFLVWEHDDLYQLVCPGKTSFFYSSTKAAKKMLEDSFIPVPFNPTAENMAQYLVEVIGPQQLAGTGVILAECRIEETAKCSATYALNTLDLS